MFSNYMWLPVTTQDRQIWNISVKATFHMKVLSSDELIIDGPKNGD